MTETEKLEIQKAVVQWIDDENPQRSASQLAKLSDVNIRYIVAIKRGDDYTTQNDKQYNIKDEYYLKLGEVVLPQPLDSIHFDNRNFQRIQQACDFARETRRRILIDSYDSGLGKTYSLEYYSRKHVNVLYIKVTSLMKGRDLIEILIDKLNIRYEKRVSNVVKLRDITDKLIRPGYLIILDEMESCSPDMYRVLKDLEDATYRRCGLIISGLGITQELEIGAKRNKKLMRQLWRRFRANRIMLRNVTRADVENACHQYDITDRGAIKVLQDMITDYAMLNEYIRDIRKLIIEAKHELNATNVKSLFLTDI